MCNVTESIPVPCTKVNIAELRATTQEEFDELYNQAMAMRFSLIFMLRLFFVLLVVCALLAGQAGSPAFPDGGAPDLAYVAGTAPGVSVIDVAQQRVSRILSIDGDPHTILLSSDGRFLYTTQPAQGRVSVLDAASGKIQCSLPVPGRPTLLALAPFDEALYVAGNDDMHVRAIDPSTCKLQQTFLTPGLVSGLAVAILTTVFPKSPGYQLVVATTATLSIFDSSGKLLMNIPLPAEPEYLTFPPGPAVYLATRQGTVFAVDLSTQRVTPPLLTGGMFGPMDFDDSTNEVYVPDLQRRQIDVLAPVTSRTDNRPREPEHIIHMEGIPEAVAITSGGQLGFVALDDGRVVMLDIPGRQVVTTIAVGGHPHFIITGLCPGLCPSSTPQTTPQQMTQPDFLWLGYVLLAIMLISALLLVFLLFVVRKPGQNKP